MPTHHFNNYKMLRQKKKKKKKTHNSENKMNLKLMIFFHFLAIKTHIQNLQTPQQSINTHKLNFTNSQCIHSHIHSSTTAQ